MSTSFIQHNQVDRQTSPSNSFSKQKSPKHFIDQQTSPNNSILSKKSPKLAATVNT